MRVRGGELQLVGDLPGAVELRDVHGLAVFRVFDSDVLPGFPEGFAYDVLEDDVLRGALPAQPDAFEVGARESRPLPGECDEGLRVAPGAEIHLAGLDEPAPLHRPHRPPAEPGRQVAEFRVEVAQADVLSFFKYGRDLLPDVCEFPFRAD